MQGVFLLYIGIGGFFGAISRFLISSSAGQAFGNYLPFGTLSVNVIGSFIIGILALYFEQNIAPEHRALFITGFLGSLTTFSAFSLETTLMIEQSHYFKAASHIFLNVFLSVGATILAMVLYKKYIY
ncbi:MAG TPA: fluoride efflux transporter CrcB [Campylobacterales bacterium]|nr:fluoride efflux transporter CrcB [Campylobacterales bacterium]